ncbi:MAG: hypothetical protein ACLFSF_06500 [Desulfonatronovibrio sp.]
MDYYHGTLPGNIKSIQRLGFKNLIWRSEDGKRFGSGGALGIGTYLSHDWKEALFFGEALFRVQLQEGTKIVDISKDPDMKIINSLRRKFGHVLFKPAADFHKIIPRNKHLKQKELIELTRYHYFHTWGRAPRRHSAHYKITSMHHDSLEKCLSMLRQYGFHGYGNPANDIGLVITCQDRIIIKELVTVVDDCLDPVNYRKPLDKLRVEFEKMKKRKGPSWLDAYKETEDLCF